MRKDIYTPAEIEIISLTTQDIITTSDKTEWGENNGTIYPDSWT